MSVSILKYLAPAPLLSALLLTAVVTSCANPHESTSTLSISASPYPVHATYVDFYRNLTPELWGLEFQYMKAIDINTLILVSVGHLQPITGQPLTCSFSSSGSYTDSSAYALAFQGFLYPSDSIDRAQRPTIDLLETLLSLADANGMNVYVGSLQTATDWTDGSAFCALRSYNHQIASEILARYGQHNSLKGWYFTQEIWMNWVKLFGAPTNNAASYYGTNLLSDWVAAMKALDSSKSTAAAVVIKDSSDGPMPGLNPDDLQHWTTGLLGASKLDLLMPQDGAGAQAGAPPLSDLPAYYDAMAAAARSPGINTALWSTLEIFTPSTQQPFSGEQYPPVSDISRLQSQFQNVRPYVTGYISWNFGDHMSPQATYYPVEASQLYRKYQSAFNPQTAPSDDVIPLQNYWYPSQTPDATRPDSSRSLLSDRTGGGYNDTSLATWVGFSNTNYGSTTVDVVADLGSVRTIHLTRALTQSASASGIFHPSQVTVEVSSDNYTWIPFGTASNFPSDTQKFAVIWAEVSGAASARFVRWTFTYNQWLFLAELEVIGL